MKPFDAEDWENRAREAESELEAARSILSDCLRVIEAQFPELGSGGRCDESGPFDLCNECRDVGRISGIIHSARVTIANATRET